MTLSASDNCGSLLQTYALKKLLQTYGDVEVINFSSESSHKLYDLPPVNFKTQISFLCPKKKKKYIQFKKCKQAYEQFRRNYIEINCKELFSKDLITIKDKYDIVVAGSDQIWNVQMRDFDESFFLGWTGKKKVAYAPSLGGTDIEISKNAKKLVLWLNEFDYLSVREEAGRKCLSKLCLKTVTKVLDPTLLLNENEWKKFIGAPLIKEDYIFYYSWAYCYENVKEIVKREGERVQLPVIVIDSRKWLNQDENKYGFILSEHEGPLAFLNLMYYAQTCFIESFHGMIFAYIFKKNFWLLDIHENLIELDSRLMELVTLLNVESRVLTQFNYDQKNMQTEIKYSENKALNNLRNISQKYIEEAMTNI